MSKFILITLSKVDMEPKDADYRHVSIDFQGPSRSLYENHRFQIDFEKPYGYPNKPFECYLR